MADGRRFDIEGGKSVCAERWEVKSRDNPVTPWYTGSWTWKKMKDNEVSNKKSLVARNNERCREICR